MVWFVAVLMIVALGLNGAAPAPGAVPPGRGLPTSWLWSWLRQDRAEPATGLAGLPVQESGSAAGRPHYVPAGATRAGGGVGSGAGKGAGELPLDQPHTASRVPVTTTTADGAGRFDPRTSRRLPWAASATQDVYQNKDGSYTRRVNENVVNFRSADGIWTPVDTSLDKGPNGRWRVRANSLRVDFAPSASDAALATVRLDGLRGLSYSLLGAANVAPEVAGSTATYHNALPDTDLVLRAVADGVKETLILRSARATSWTFPLRLDGLAPRLEPDGSVSLVDRAGTVAGRIPSGFLADSRYDPHSNEPAESNGVRYEIVTVAGGPALRVSVDRAWLSDPRRVFPVQFDPTFTVGTSATTYAETTNPGDNSGKLRMKAGTSDGGASIKAYSFLQFTGFASTFANAKVSSAVLHIFDSWAYTCTAQPFFVNPITSAWTPSGVTAYPGPSFDPTPIGSTSQTPGAACQNTGGDPAIGTWMTVSLSGATFDSWVRGGANNGLAITASQTDSVQWKQFDSRNGPFPPYLDVTYTANQAPGVDSQYPPDNFDTPSLTPELMAHGVDLDNWPGSPLFYDFKVYRLDGTTLTTIAESGWVNVGDWVVPAGILSWGKLFLWSVQVRDGGPLLSDPNPTVRALRTPVPQPPVTSRLSQKSGSHGLDPRTGNYTTSETDADVSTAGPALSVVRNYNSADPRAGQALGAGWSSIFDVKATEQTDPAGTGVITLTVTYPDGSEIAFGRNGDGSFVPPPGRFASIAPLAGGGYSLTDKNNTVYRFSQPLTTGVFGITSITDAAGRAETFTYAGGHIIALTSAVSGRNLNLTWSTPAGASAAHVATVATNPVVEGAPATALTWTYSYSGDHLVKVCPPTSSTNCTGYAYSIVSGYADAAQNAVPRSYWRLNEAAGTTAGSSVLVNEGTDNATYTDVTLGQPPALPGSTSTSASFNGVSSYVDIRAGLVNNANYQTISLWFRTTASNGVLFSYETDPISNSTTTQDYTPSLYIGSDGKLLGEFRYAGGTANISSAGSVADGNWHHVVLTGAGNTQSLYLDGGQVGSRTGMIQVADAAAGHVYVGTGFLGGRWPDEPHYSTTDGTGYRTFFNGAISDVVFYDHWMPASTVAKLYAAGHTVAKRLSTVTRRSGVVEAQLSYDTVTAAVSRLTDVNGGTWQLATPVASGSSQVYGSAVLGGGPIDYWRLGDGAGSAPANEVKGGTAAYSAVTLGAAGPFADATAAGFDGTSSYLALPPNVYTRDSVGATMPGSAQLWFTTTHAGGVLLATQASPLGATACPCVPILWIAADGRLRGVIPASTPTGPLTAALLVGKCLSAGSPGVFGNPVEVRSCGNPVDQSWTMAGDGTVRARTGLMTGCMSVADAGTANGSLVQMQDCTGSANQVWEAYNGGLRNPASGRCLDDPGGSTVDGTDLQIWDCNSSSAQQWAIGMVSAGRVDDGKWHQVTLATDSYAQSMYLDGVPVQSSTSYSQMPAGNQQFVYVGAGPTGSGWAAGLPANTTTYFNGTISDVAFYQRQLPPEQVLGQHRATKSAVGLTPVATATVTDPAGKLVGYRYDLFNAGRPLSITDPLGNTTAFGYDTAGFLYTVRDPNGVLTSTGHDIRGNLVSRTTCQNQSTGACSTAYFTYYPDDTSATLTPDPRNDLVLTFRDGRLYSAPTTVSYDAQGNATALTTPAVPGFPSGRTTTTSYTDGTTVAAADTGFAPPGLPATTTSPGGAVRLTRYLHNGDVAETTDAAGLIVRYTYDGVGRLSSSTEVSDMYPSGLTTTYTYDGLGELTTVTSPPVTNRVTGAVHTARTTNVFNPDDAIVNQSVADLTGGDAARTISTTYNAKGQLTTVTDPTGAVTRYGYDVYGNRTRTVDALSHETDYSYDANRHLLTTTLVGYTGDPANPQPPTDLVESSRAYDPAGRLASVTDTMGWVTSFTYFDNGLLATVVRSDPARGTLFTLQSNTYDGAGNLTGRKTDGDTTNTRYVLDAAGRVTSATWDLVGASRTAEVVYSADDAVIGSKLSDSNGIVAVSAAGYDPMGRMTSRTVYNDGSSRALGWWKLNESSGTAAWDSAAGLQLGTLNSGVSWSDSAARFNGTSGVITTPASVKPTQSFSVSAWVKLNSMGTANQTAVSQNGLYESALALQYSGPDNKWAFAMGTTSTSSYRTLSTATAVANVWTHLVGVFDAVAGRMTLYVNGVQNSTAAARGSGTARQTVVIGRGQHLMAPTDWLNGSVSNVQIYPRAVSSAEVSTLYGNDRAGSALAVARLTTAWTRDQRGLVTSITDPTGAVTAYASDEAGRRSVSALPAVDTETDGGPPVSAHPIAKVGYDTFGAPVESADPNGNVTTIRYDAGGRPTSLTLPSYLPPGSGTAITSSATRGYDALGHLIASTDALNQQTTYTYDQMGRLATVTGPDSRVSHTTYDLNGDPLSMSDPTGATKQATYDYLGRTLTATAVVVRQPAPAGFTTTYAYTAPGGRLSSITSPAGVVTTYTYDQVGEVTSVGDGAHNTTSYRYDAGGRVVRTTAADASYRTVSYDLAGLPVTTAAYDASNALLATTSASYDANGNVTSATDARGTTTTFSYDATGTLVRAAQPVTAATSITTTFGYDMAGNRTRYTDGRGNSLITTYNSWNLPESQVEPATAAYPNAADRTFTIGYDANGRPVSQTSPGGVQVTNSYDNVGHVTGQSGVGAEAPTAARSFGYDLAGRLTSASTPNGTQTFSYDDRGLLLSTRGPAGSSTFTYTADGLMASRADAAGTTAYTYDTAGRLSTLADPATGGTITYGYNALNQIATVGYGVGGNVRSFGYDSQHRPTSDVLKTAAGATIGSIGYGYDSNGDLTSKTTVGFAGSAVNTYSYDLARRLTSWNDGTTTTNYGYDASGNRTAIGGRTLSYNQRNQLTNDAGTSYSYTRRGTLANTSSGSTMVTSTSDAFDQTITRGGQTYGYDALGRVLTAAADGSTRTLFYTGTGNTVVSDGTTTYTYDSGDNLAAIRSTTGVFAWTDQHTDVVGQFTGTGVTLAGSVTYDPLGNAIASSNAKGNLGYQSGWTDSSNGTVNMAARWYNPSTGQFSTRDSANLNPAANPTVANRYAYANDNPLLTTDPSGLAPVPCGKSCGNYGCIAGWRDCYSGPPVDPCGACSDEPFTCEFGTVSDECGTEDGFDPAVGSTIGSAVGQVGNGGGKGSGGHGSNGKSGGGKGSGGHTYTGPPPPGAAQAPGLPAPGVAAGPPPSGWTPADTHAVLDSLSLVPVVDVIFDGANALLYLWEGDEHNAASYTLFALTDVFGGHILAKAGEWIFKGGRWILKRAFKIGAEDTEQLLEDLAKAERDAKNAGDAEPNPHSPDGEPGSPPGGPDPSGGSKAGGDPHGGGNPHGGSNPHEGGNPHGGGKSHGGDPHGDAPPPGTGKPAPVECHSFAADTNVLMADGSAKAIKDIEAGDKVVATDPATGTTAAEPVTALHLNHDTDLTDITVTAAPVGPTSSGTDTGDGTIRGPTAILHTTAHHPFWDQTAHTWALAADLVAGHRLSTLDGHVVTVVAVHGFTGSQQMRDLTVAGVHTYYVVAGTTPVLVHNCGGGVDPAGHACNCSNPPPYGSGNAYTVGYETDLPITSYPGQPRGLHFQDANRSLWDAMSGDPRFAADMEDMIPGITDFLTPGPRGGVPDTTPAALGWTWHHAVEPGKLQLVPVSQHRYGGPLQALLHPGGIGGFKIWG
jgi:RHS repeat-associated protein